MRVLIRCDASLEIGSGHVMRCRNLARALQFRGAEVVFLCRERECDLIAFLDKDFPVIRLPALPASKPRKHGLQGRELYRYWLGCSQSQDAQDCLNAIRSQVTGLIDWLVVDHYGLDITWEQQMCEALSENSSEKTKLIVFDDLADRKHFAQVLVDSNRLKFSDFDAYRSKIPTGCNVLLGPNYAPLEPLYAQLQKLVPRRNTLQRVLIYFGASDHFNYTTIALEALKHSEFANLSVDVVLGASAPHQATVSQLVRDRPLTNLHHNISSLAALIMRADLAIGAAGTVSWERAALALPTIIIPVAENQQQGALALATVGAAQLADLQASANPTLLLMQSILVLMQRPERLRELSDAALSLGDGRGLARILTAMITPNSSLRLRPATIEDEHLYYSWANEYEVRRQSFNTGPISLDHHKCWFRSRLQSPHSLLRVMVDVESLQLGQIRFERDVNEPARVKVSFSLDVVARGHGLASKLLKLGLDELAQHWSAVVNAYGEVRSSNEASAKAFLRAGFKECPSQRQGVRCFNMHISTSL